MVKHRKAESELDSLAERARALLSATTDIADEKVTAAREALQSLLESSSDLYEKAHDTAVASVKQADKSVREHPYRAIGLALGVGAAVGFVLGRQSVRE